MAAAAAAGTKRPGREWAESDAFGEMASAQIKGEERRREEVATAEDGGAEEAAERKLEEHSGENS